LCQIYGFSTEAIGIFAPAEKQHAERYIPASSNFVTKATLAVFITIY